MLLLLGAVGVTRGKCLYKNKNLGAQASLGYQFLHLIWKLYWVQNYESKLKFRRFYRG